jgi:hypothetical protein
MQSKPVNPRKSNSPIPHAVPLKRLGVAAKVDKPSKSKGESRSRQDAES